MPPSRGGAQVGLSSQSPEKVCGRWGLDKGATQSKGGVEEREDLKGVANTRKNNLILSRIGLVEFNF